MLLVGFLRKKLCYTAVSDCGLKEENIITDDLPFQCIIEREDANENDSFMVTGSTVLCEVFAKTQNFGTHPVTNDQVAYKFVEKDIVKICIRKNCFNQ